MKDTPKKRLSTGELTNGIIRTKDLKRYIRNHEDAMEDIQLTSYLEDLLKQKDMLRADVIQRANIDRSFGFQIFSGLKKPSRDKVIQLAIGFGMDHEEANALLKVARKAELYARIRRDAILIYCLSRHHSVFETQYMLAEAGLPALGEVR